MTIAKYPRPVLTIILVFLTLLLLSRPLSHVPSTANASTEYVNPGESIQEAIDSAQPGDTVVVLSGIYSENLVINKRMTLIGESKETTIIDGSGRNQSVIQISASSVAISGFTIQNSSRTASFAGIKIAGHTCNITGNYVKRTKIGISVTSLDSTITRNLATDNGHGIALSSSSNVTVAENTVSRNTVGISLASSSNNLITSNRVVNSSTGGHGIYLSSDSTYNTIIDNELTGNYHGMWLYGASYNTIAENTVANNELLGIELADSPHNNAYHNNFVNNGREFMRHIKIGDKSDGTWDNGYPSGGNYWHEFPDVDEYAGPNQDQPGNDGIWDNPYVIDENNKDNYPSILPFGNISHILLKVDSISPIADAGTDRTVSLGSPVTFDATESSDNVGIVSYEWDFGDGSKAVGTICTHAFNRTGTFTVTLTVKDAAQNSGAVSISLLVVSEDPSAFWFPVAGTIVVVATAIGFWVYKDSKSRKKRRRRARPRRRR